jgi:hypothetical protein
MMKFDLYLLARGEQRASRTVRPQVRLAHRHMEPLRQCSLAANQHATFDGWKTLTTRPIDQPINLAA